MSKKRDRQNLGSSKNSSSRPKQLTQVNQTQQTEETEQFSWIDFILGISSILIGGIAIFLFTVNLHRPLTLPLSIIGITISTVALGLSLIHRQVNPSFQTIGLLLSVGIFMTHYVRAEGVGTAIADVRRVINSEESIGLFIFPKSNENSENTENKEEANQFTVDPKNIESTK